MASWLSRRRPLVGLGAVLAALVLAAPAAAATTVDVNCSGFGSALSAATAGETIVLSGLCTGSNASFTLPSVTGLTIEGASGGTNGFDGTGVSSAALNGTSVAGGLTLKNLTFEHYSLSQPTVYLSLTGGALPKFEQVRFLDNSANNGSGPYYGPLVVADGSSGCPYTGTLVISNSTFSGNTGITSLTAGPISLAAAGIDFYCTSPVSLQLQFTNNRFTDNTAETAGATALGAGLYVSNNSSGVLQAQQSHNLFKNNRIVSSVSPAGGVYEGAGEWLGSVDATSLDDEFVGNSLPAPSGNPAYSWGAGLYTVRSNCFASTTPVSFTATNLVAVGNAIGAPTSGGWSEGAGIYAGCTTTSGSQGFHLTLVNSTVSGNSAPGGVAGVDGETNDYLILRNSIVYGDTGAGSSELGGFGIGTGTGTVTSTYSDLCAGSSPYTGTGNLCADPMLVDAVAGNVREQSGSPTIDAGSNSLVTTGIDKDFYGAKRIAATMSTKPVVDIGAAESQTPFHSAQTRLIHARVKKHKVILRLQCHGTSGYTCTGLILARTIERVVHGRVVRLSNSANAHGRKVTVAKRRYQLATGHAATLTLKLNHRGRALLKQFVKLPETVLIKQLFGLGHLRTVAHRNRVIKR